MACPNILHPKAFLEVYTCWKCTVQGLKLKSRTGTVLHTSLLL